MNVSCPECRSVFRVDPAKVPDGGVRARCSVCGGIIRIAASAPNADFADVPPAIARATPMRSMTPAASRRIETAAVPSGESPIAASMPEQDKTPGSTGAEASPEAPVEASRDGASAADTDDRSGERDPGQDRDAAPAPSSDAGAAGHGQHASPASASLHDAEKPGDPQAPASQHTTAEEPPQAEPQPPARQEPPADQQATDATPDADRPSAPAPSAPYVPSASAGSTRQASPADGGWGRSAPAAWAPSTAAAAAASATPSESPRPVTPPGAPRVAPRAPTPAAGTPTPGIARRPLNPFLANDRNVKAKRLARALVSDMVAYNPSEREAGLRDGSLKQRFREEIKKSYEEYVEQMGKEFAETTTHFQDALNDVLAGGQRLF